MNQTLDSLLVRLGRIWKSSEIMLSGSPGFINVNGLFKLKEAAMTLNRDLALWQWSQSQDFKLTVIGKLSSDGTQSIPEVCYWPGNVDVYFDLYVAAAWNISRTARCFLISLILQVSSVINDGEDHGQEKQDAIYLLNDILASVPYHLAEDVQGFFRYQGECPKIVTPGRPVGGMFLMHPLYIASRLPIVPPEMQEYMRRCLLWAGRHMGIGQAALLAKVRSRRRLSPTLP